jgi:hypothetical protein
MVAESERFEARWYSCNAVGLAENERSLMPCESSAAKEYQDWFSPRGDGLLVVADFEPDRATLEGARCARILALCFMAAIAESEGQ